ncbi:hypothetical protein GCM10007978_10860 [Shewanella hanedai]|uniref:Uncharacterized protein n=1 Tax=Shewanella hanedai TaxID=25 RepID=A0A553JRH9_SHEHA|nr:STY4851/ECs_5259 family protein [Shewanella hanedai]TRY15073.1 hypothetical protein FN961_07130 [Shewanella hanedai]GGI75005.1 hypothetical protein GCM10007978_10860 [Shewanella hanedai]
MSDVLVSNHLVQMQKWLNDFSRNREHPLVTPLWRFKVTDEEFISLKKLITNLFIARNPKHVINKSSAFDKIFTLYVSTWLQRNYDGGKSKWQPVCDSVGLRDYRPYYSAIRNSVERGLKLWKISVHSTASGDSFISTLYCQGGFPNFALLGEQKGKVPEYLNTVIDHYRQFHLTTSIDEIANEALGNLPITLQQNAFAELAVSLINHLMLLRDQFDLFSASEPVLKLDLEKPTWRDDLPFLLCDQGTQELISRLLSSTAKLIKREQNPVRVLRTLEPAIESWQLVAETYINKTIHPEDLNRCLDESSLPVYFDLYSHVDSGGRYRSAAFNLKGNSTKRWQVVTNKNRFFNLDAAGDISYSLWSDENELGNATYYQGEALNNDLPWIFQSSNDKYRYLAQGNATIAADEAIIAFSGEVIAANVTSSVEEVGSLGIDGIKLYRVRGEVLAKTLQGSFKIATACEESKPLNCRMEGNKVIEAISSKHVFRGLPNIIAKEHDLDEFSVCKSQLFWQAKNSDLMVCLDSVLTAGKEQIQGHGSLSWIIDEQLKWQSKLAILPTESQFNVIPFEQGETELKLLGFERDIDISLIEKQKKWLREVDKYDDMYLCEIQLPRRLTDVMNPVLSWGLDNEVTLELATQQAGVCLVTPEGRPFIHSRNKLTVNDLYTHKLRIAKPEAQSETYLSISAVLFHDKQQVANLSESVILPKEALVTIDCKTLLTMSRLLLSQSDDLRAEVKFRFFLGKDIMESVVPSVEVFKHATPNFWADNELKGIKVTKSRSHPNRSNIKMFAKPMWDLAREAVELPTVENEYNDMIFAIPDTEEQGPWFLYSDKQNLIQPRAVIIGDSSVVYECSDIKTVENAIRYLPRGDEQGFDFSYMDQLIIDLSNDYLNPEWFKLQGLVDALNYAAADTFHLFRRLIKKPQAMVDLLAKQDDLADFDLVWSIAQDMPFEWFSVPAAMWFKSFNHKLDSLKTKLEPVAQILPEQDYAALLKSTFESDVENLRTKGDYFATLLDIFIAKNLNVKAQWMILNAWGENSIMGRYVNSRKDLFERQDGKLLLKIQNRAKDENLKSYINEYLADEVVPTNLSGMLASHLPEAVKNRQIFSIDLPIKMALYNFDCLNLEQVLSTVSYDMDEINNNINFTYARLQSWDRQWLNQAMANATQIAYLTKEEGIQS